MLKIITNETLKRHKFLGRINLFRRRMPALRAEAVILFERYEQKDNSG